MDVFVMNSLRDFGIFPPKVVAGIVTGRQESGAPKKEQKARILKKWAPLSNCKDSN
jgi:hypothetical protein